MISDDALSTRLSKAAAPAHSVVLPSDVVAHLVSDARRSALARSGRWKVTAGVAGGALVLGGLTAAPAAGAIREFLVQTGWAAEGTEVIPDSEWVDTSGADLGEYIEWVYPEWLPLAPGQSKAEIIEKVRVHYAATPALTQEVGLLLTLEREVQLGWLDEWMSARAAGDFSRQAVAAAILHESASWPARVATDGGGVVFITEELTARIVAGDFEAAQAFAQIEGSPAWDGIDRTDTASEIFAQYQHEQAAE